MAKFLHLFQSVFYNLCENRLRAFWRLLIGIALGFLILDPLKMLARYILAFLLMLAGQISFGALGNPQQLSQQVNIVYEKLPLIAGIYSLLILSLVVLIFMLLAHWMDRRSWRDYGFHFSTAWWRDLGFGLLLGTMLMGVVFGIEYLLGWVSIQGMLENGQPKFPFWQLFLDGFLAYVLVGAQEELFFRGFPIKNLAEGLNFPNINSKAAVLIPYLLICFLFGFAHANNANATLISSINLSLIGLLLGLGFILTGELAIPIGLHIAWNFAQGYIFGFPVSGNDNHLSLLANQQTGPVVWTGGAFGPEGGLLGLVVALLGVLLIFVWVRWTRNQNSVQTELAQYLPVQHKVKSN